MMYVPDATQADSSIPRHEPFARSWVANLEAADVA